MIRARQAGGVQDGALVLLLPLSEQGCCSQASLEQPFDRQHRTEAKGVHGVPGQILQQGLMLIKVRLHLELILSEMQLLKPHALQAGGEAGTACKKQLPMRRDYLTAVVPHLLCASEALGEVHAATLESG